MSLLGRGIGRYTFSEAPQAGQSILTSTVPTTRLFAEVALDVNIKEIADRLFTYEIPDHLRAEVFVGSQVLIPFGKQELVCGFVVSISDDKKIHQKGELVSASAENTRQITDVLDSGSLFPPAYVEFLYWISQYYLCSISEVLNAAIPAEIAPRVKRMVRLSQQATGTEHQLSNLIESPASFDDSQKIKSVLREAGKSLSIKTLRDRSGLPNRTYYSNLAKLRRKGELEIFCQTDEGAVPKLVNHVIWSGQDPKSKRQEEIVNYLKRHNGCLPLSQLIQETKSTSATIKRMVHEGILSINQVDSFRDPIKGLYLPDGTRPELSENQSKVFEVLEQGLKEKLQSPLASENGPEPPWLLHGVTGSGKTEIYLRLIEEALKHGRAALLLVPEISLTPQLAQRLVGRFGEQVAVWHSALSAGECFDTWRRVQSGELKVVLGARSAILANIPQLGLIILDEEHDGSYKQSTPSPRYSARHLACQRAWRESCFVLFGSATPDTKTYYEAKQAGRILELPERIFKQNLPESVLVDMRNEFAAGNKSIISGRLKTELSGCLERKEQAILLINRRGYASHVFCRACGQVLMCKHCSVSLVFHSLRSLDPQAEHGAIGSGRLTCHHCGFSQAAGEICPSCLSPFLKQAGMGTQKVYEEIIELFPESRVLRLDSDVTSKKGAYQEIFQKFVAGQADILIGTQIVAKGLDIANVSLVGVLAADAAFNLPDFRSLERGFQLLTQVSGRAGRGDIPGKVVLQTHNTDLPALLLSKNQDYASFIQSELATREQFEYPPFSRLLRILASGPDSAHVESELERLAEELSNYLEELESIKILGPAPCLIERIKGQYRHHIIIKNLMGDIGQQVIASFLRGRPSPAGVRLTIDVDPVDLI